MPLDQEDYIEIHRPKGLLDVGMQTNAVNFNYINKTGIVQETTKTILPNSLVRGNYSIDWKSDDAFTRALKTIETNSAQRITRSDSLQALLHKDHWSHEDRTQWEMGISQIVADETGKIPGFKNYRTSATYTGASKTTRVNAEDLSRLNDLSSDIEHNTEKLKFDCGIESLIKGSIIQRLENDHNFLPHQASGTDFKKASNYFYATGGATFSGQETNANHATIFTPGGNTIEATATASYTYKQSLYGNSTLEQLARGKSFYAVGGSVYNQPTVEDTPDRKAQTQEQTLYNGNYLAKAINDRNSLLQYEKLGTNVATEAGKDNLIMLASEKRKGDQTLYEIKLFQKQMQGTPQEGYVMVGYDGAYKKTGTPPPTLTRDYTDELSGKTYTASAEFSPGAVKTEIAHKTSIAGVTVYENTLASRSAKINPESDTIKAFSQALTGISIDFKQTAARTGQKADLQVIPLNIIPSLPSKPNEGKVAPHVTAASIQWTKIEPDSVPAKGALHAPVQDTQPDIWRIQTYLHDRGLYKGSLDGLWNAKTNQALNDFLLRTQTDGRRDGSYKGEIDRLYTPLTYTTLKKNGVDDAFIAALDRLEKNQTLAAIYKPEGISRASVAGTVQSSIQQPASPDINRAFLNAVEPVKTAHRTASEIAWGKTPSSGPQN